MKFTTKVGTYIDNETKLDALDFPYELDNFQKHAANSIEHGHHVVVTAHTGSGKTSVAEYAIAHHINKNKRVVYTTPIKALSNQIHKDLKRKYPSWDIGIWTGDIKVNSNAQIVIATTEIVRNNLFRDRDDLKLVGCVIFDEVHWIKDRDRGHVWEECIVAMPKKIQLVMLSATIPAAYFSHFSRLKQKKKAGNKSTSFNLPRYSLSLEETKSNFSTACSYCVRKKLPLLSITV